MRGVRLKVGESVSWLVNGFVVKVLLTSFVGKDELAFHGVCFCKGWDTAISCHTSGVLILAFSHDETPSCVDRTRKELWCFRSPLCDLTGPLKDVVLMASGLGHSVVIGEPSRALS